MNKFIIIAIILAVIMLAIWGLWNWSRNVLEVENISGKAVPMVTITVCRESYHLKNLPSNESRRIFFKVTGDSGFQVDVSFDDGSKISKNFGYVTNGTYNNQAKVKIYPDHIEGIQR